MTEKRPVIQNDGTIAEFNYITLAVENIRLSTSENGTIDVQLGGDKDHRWWPGPPNTNDLKGLLEAMEKKRVYARLRTVKNQLRAQELVIMFAEPVR